MKRLPSDGYFTPEPLALAIAQRLHDLGHRPRTILEPSSGGGAFVRAARAIWPDAKITAIDVNPGAQMFAQGADFMAWDFLSVSSLTPKPALILGNPPYNDAEAHVAHALTRLAAGGVLAFLLRLSFVGSAARAATVCKGEGRYLAPIVPRPSFTADGATDSSEYGLFVWGLEGASRLGEPLYWEKKRRAA